MLPRSLTGRLMLASMAGVLAAAIAGALVIWMQFWPTSPTALVRAELQEEIDDIVAGMRVDAVGLAVRLNRSNASIYDAMPKDTAYVVFDQAGRVAASSVEGPALDRLMAMRAGDRSTSVPSGGDRLHLELAEARTTHAGRPYLIRVARSDRLVTTLQNHAGELYLRGASIAIALALCTFTLVVYLTIRHMVRPLQQASQVAARLEPRNLSVRLRSADLPAEIVPLIEAFNDALGRLDDGYRIQQEFLASAAHELKTPLALLQAEIELGGAADTAALLRDTALMARVVHQLLHLAEASEGNNYTLEPLQLSTEVQEAVDYMHRLADKRAIAIELEASGDAVVQADRGALFVLVKNLLENAIHHAPDASRIIVRVRPDGFSVADDGPGVAPEQVALLFQRFWRVPNQEHEGAGLGLTICREICHAHRWEIAYERANTGACFRVITAPV
jgi:signal transduction histidine kinase